MLPAAPAVRDLNRRASAFLTTQAALLRHPGSARGRIVAGLVDAAMSSAAGLGAGLYAAHFLAPSLLGAYSMYFVAFLLGGYAPVMLYLLPVRVAALEVGDVRSRLQLVRPSLLRGVLVSGVAAALTPLAGVFALGTLSLAEIAPLALTAAFFVLVSPLQDHLRAMFHLAAQPWKAVWVSAVRLGVLCLSVVVLHSLPIPRTWVPFGSLALGAGVSLGFGLLLAGAAKQSWAHLESMRSLFRAGGPLLAATLLPFGAQFLAGGLIASFTTIDNLGYSEASRQVAQPIHVAALGLGQALTPLLMQAAQARSRRAIARPRRLFVLGLLACTLVYLPLVGFSHAANPVAALLPNAYHVEGLVFASIAAIVVFDLSSVPQSELAASRSGSLLLLPALVASAAQLVFVLVAMRQLGAYAVPLGIVVNGVIMTAWSHRLSNRLLDEGL